MEATPPPSGETLPDCIHTIPQAEDPYSTSRKSKFRFKSKRKRSAHDDDEPSRSCEFDPYGKRRRTSSAHSPTRRHRAHHRRRHHHHRRSKHPSPSSDPTSPPDLDPDTAFRESLFDALADDEGAAFWEAVYGQPIHTYPAVKAGPGGELERMTDDEYTAYVRARMFEKTHQHVVEERERRRLRRERERERAKREEAGERAAFEKEVEVSLRRGRERRDRARWRRRWDEYAKGWDDLIQAADAMREIKEEEAREAESGRPRKARANTVRDMIPWPVESGAYADVNPEAVERFFRHVVPSAAAGDASSHAAAPLSARLKIERVRWHPDRIQQRLGGFDLDERTTRAVTAVFQVVDRLWTEMRDGAAV